MLRNRCLASALLAFCLASTVHAQVPQAAAPPARPVLYFDDGRAPAKTPPAREAAAPYAERPVLQFDDGSHRDSSGGPTAGGTVYFLRPYINNNTAFVTSTGIGTATPSTTSQEFEWNWHLATGAWLGWSSSCGLGFRARHFYFDNDSKTADGTLTVAEAGATTITPPTGLSPVVGVPPRGFQSPGILLQSDVGTDLLSANSDLHIQTIDAEATYSRNYGSFSMIVALGGRYLQMHQNYRASLFNQPDAATVEFSTLSSGHNFNGGGPTVAWEGRWRVGCSHVSIFGSVRGSLLVGSSRFSAIFNETIVDPVNGSQHNVATTDSRDDRILPIGELEAGLEYGRSLGRSRVFVRGAVVDQTYFDAGSASGRDGNLSLFGAQVSVGVDY